MCVVFGGGSKTNGGAPVRKKREKEKDTKSKFSLASTHERAVRSKSRLWKAARKTLMTMDRANERRRRKKRKEGDRGGRLSKEEEPGSR